MSNFNYSFEEWCKDNNRIDLLERWDFDKNKCLPSEVSFKSNNKYYFKCPEGLHDSKDYKLCDIHKSSYPLLKCKQCNSFAQYIIDEYDEDYLSSIWSDENTDSPWDVAAHSNKKYKFICLKNEHQPFDMTADHYVSGVGCPICSNHKIIKENSLGTINPEVLDLWSDKNDKTPYEYAPVSGEVVWWKCNNGIHEDYQRKISNSQSRDFICPECGKLQGWFNRKEDIAGQQFGELTALYLDKSKLNNKRRTYWICKCSCGNLHSVDVTNLKTGNTTTCGDRMAHYSGENNGHWKGGITPKLVAERESTRYHDWRKLVYSKDYYTCQCCGNIHNGLNAHHIKNFSSNEELRYDLNNGITLCSECHPTASPVGFHNIYGTRNNTPDYQHQHQRTFRQSQNQK